MYDQLYEYIRSYVPITTDDWNFLEPQLIPQKVKKREIFLNLGEVCRSISFMVSGAMRSYEITEDGREICHFFALEQCFVTNYWSFLSQRASERIFQALEPTQLIHLPYAAVNRGYDYSKNWERFGRIMAEQVFMEELGRRNDLLHKTSAGRYAYIEKHYPEWIERIPLRHLATYLGITPESLSRLRRQRKG